jgi:hypothetical protein
MSAEDLYPEAGVQSIQILIDLIGDQTRSHSADFQWHKKTLKNQEWRLKMCFID